MGAGHAPCCVHSPGSAGPRSSANKVRTMPEWPGQRDLCPGCWPLQLPMREPWKWTGPSLCIQTHGHWSRISPFDASVCLALSESCLLLRPCRFSAVHPPASLPPSHVCVSAAVWVPDGTEAFGVFGDSRHPALKPLRPCETRVVSRGQQRAVAAADATSRAVSLALADLRLQRAARGGPSRRRVPPRGVGGGREASPGFLSVVVGVCGKPPKSRSLRPVGLAAGKRAEPRKQRGPHFPCWTRGSGACPRPGVWGSARGRGRVGGRPGRGCVWCLCACPCGSGARSRAGSPPPSSVTAQPAGSVAGSKLGCGYTRSGREVHPRSLQSLEPKLPVTRPQPGTCPGPTLSSTCKDNLAGTGPPGSVWGSPGPSASPQCPGRCLGVCRALGQHSVSWGRRPLSAPPGWPSPRHPQAGPAFSQGCDRAGLQARPRLRAPSGRATTSEPQPSKLTSPGRAGRRAGRRGGQPPPPARGGLRLAAVGAGSLPCAVGQLSPEQRASPPVEFADTQGLFLLCCHEVSENPTQASSQAWAAAGPGAVGRRCWCPVTGFAADPISVSAPRGGAPSAAGARKPGAASRPEGCGPAAPAAPAAPLPTSACGRGSRSVGHQELLKMPYS